MWVRIVGQSGFLSSSTPIGDEQTSWRSNLPYAGTEDVGLVIAIARYNGDAFAEAYRRHAGAVFGLAQRLLWERAPGRGDGAGDLPPALGAPRALRPGTRIAAVVPAHGRPRRAASTASVPTRRARARGAFAPGRARRRLRPRPRGATTWRRRPGPRGADARCPTSSVAPSSSRTSVATPTARWLASSSSRKAPSRAGYVPG